MKQLDRALTDFNRAIELDPQFEQTYSDRGIVYFKLGKFDRALTDLD